MLSSKSPETQTQVIGYCRTLTEMAYTENLRPGTVRMHEQPVVHRVKVM